MSTSSEMVFAAFYGFSNAHSGSGVMLASASSSLHTASISALAMPYGELRVAMRTA